MGQELFRTRPLGHLVEQALVDLHQLAGALGDALLQIVPTLFKRLLGGIGLGTALGELLRS